MAIRFSLRILIVVCFVSAAVVRAQSAGDLAKRDPDFAFVDPQSIAFARLNLTQIDPDAVDRSLLAYVADLKPQQFVADLAHRNIRHLTARLKRFKELNVERINIVLTLHGQLAPYDMLLKAPQNHIYAIVEVPDGVDPLEIARVFAEDPPGSHTVRPSKDSAANPLAQRTTQRPESSWLALHFHSAVHLKDRNFVIAGSPDLLQFVAGQSAAPRPSLKSALAAASDGPLQIAIAPPPIFGRAMQEILGPRKYHGFSIGDSLADGLQWAAFGLAQQNGETSARLVVQSQNAGGAKQFQKLLQLGFAASKSPLAEFVKLINFDLEGDRLHWRIDQQHTQPAKLAAALQPVLLGQQQRLGQELTTDNLRHIGLALLNFYDVNKAFPTPATYDKEGKPLLSWRVHILPYLDENQLYHEIRLDEPWDSPHNKQLIERMPSVYRRPFAEAKSTKTSYQVPIGERAAFRPGKKMQLRDIRDGTSKTIAIVEAAPQHEVIWTSPNDWEVDWNDPTKGLVGKPGQPLVACFLDGSVRVLPGSIDKEVLRRLLMADDGFPVQIPDTSE